MAKKLQFPKRRHTRISEDTDEKLVDRAKKLKVHPGVIIRQILEKALTDKEK